jgi:hypothetical protein
VLDKKCLLRKIVGYIVEIKLDAHITHTLTVVTGIDWNFDDVTNVRYLIEGMKLLFLLLLNTTVSLENVVAFCGEIVVVVVVVLDIHRPTES